MRSRLAWALLLAACGQGVEPVELWFGPCDELAPSGRCTVYGDTLVVWAEGLPELGSVELDGAPVEVVRSVVDGGARLEIPVGEATQVRVERGAGMPVWELQLGPGEPEAAVARASLQASREARQRGAWLSAVEALEKSESAYRDAGWSRDAAMSRWRRMEAEIRLWEIPADPTDVQQGAPADAALRFAEHFMAARLAATTRDSRVAFRSMDEALTISRRALPESWTWSANIELAWELATAGEEERARELLREVLRRADDGVSPDVLADRSSCAEVVGGLNTAWTLLQMATPMEPARRQEELVAVRAGLEATSALMDANRACDAAHLRADLWINLAWTAAELQQDAAAAAYLARVTASGITEEQRAWMLRLQAELAARRGDLSEALALWDEVYAVAVRIGDLAFEWQALDGMAAVYAAGGRVDEALADWDAAAEVFRRHGAMVPMQIGRAAFLARRARATEAQVSLLLSRGREVEAFEVVRLFRSQYLASIQLTDRLRGLDPTARAGWYETLRGQEVLGSRRQELLASLEQAPHDERQRLQAEIEALEEETAAALDTGLTSLSLGHAAELRAPRPGEVLVIWLATGSGWHVLARSARGVRAVFVPGAWSEQQAWPSAFDPLFEGAELVTMLTVGEATPADVHVLTWQGEPLVARRKVAWAMDRSTTSAASPSPEAGTALVIADPLRNLAQARVEGRQVVEALVAQGLRPRILEGREATREAMVAALRERPEILHFAGHGEVPDNPWQARLRLASGSYELADALASAQPPRLVVLVGCETARTADGHVATLGLAQAFVHAGSEAAVAAVRPVDDSLASAFSEAFYAASPVERGIDVAFREAVLSLMRSHPGADVGAFRLIVP